MTSVWLQAAEQAAIVARRERDDAAKAADGAREVMRRALERVRQLQVCGTGMPLQMQWTSAVALGAP